MGKKKFNVGEYVIGSSKKGSYADRKGTVIGYHAKTGEYQIQFEDGKTEFVPPAWLDKFPQ